MAYRVSLDGGASWAYCDGDGYEVLQNGDVESYEVHNAAGMRVLNPSISPVVPTLDGLNGDEIVITEIMMVPDPWTATGTGHWFEIRNTSNLYFDLRGVVFTSGPKVHTVTYPLILEPDSYISLGVSGDLAVNGGATHDYIWGDDANFNVITGNRSLSLIGTDSELINEVYWDENQTHPNAASQQMSNTATYANDVWPPYLDWCETPNSLSYGDGLNTGTPGGANAICPTGGPQTAPTITALTAYYDPDTLGLGLVVNGSDPEGGMVSFTLELLDENGADVLNPGVSPAVISFDAGLRPNGGTPGQYSYREDLIFQEFGFDQGYLPVWQDVRVKLVDNTGLMSGSLTRSPRLPNEINRGTACDPYGGLNRCTLGTFCGDPDASDQIPAVCALPDAYCPAYIDQAGYELTNSPGGPGWQVSGTTTTASADFEGTCGGGEGYVVYSFTGPADGTYLFTVQGNGASALNPPAVYVQQACDLVETEIACDADSGNPAMTTALVYAGETLYVVVDGSYDPDSDVVGDYTLQAETLVPASISTARAFLNTDANIVAASYTGVEGTLAIAGAQFTFLDANGDEVSMNGVPGPFLVGDVPTDNGNGTVRGAAYLPINFTQAELDSIVSVEFALSDLLDELSTPASLTLESPDVVQAGSQCDVQQGLTVWAAPTSCSTNDPTVAATCQ